MKQLIWPLMALAMVVAAPSLLAAQPAQAKETTTQRIEQGFKAEFTERLSGNDKRFAEAYSHTTWVHADLLAGDWDRAAVDLGHVRNEMMDLGKAKDLNAQAKTKINALMPMLTRLDNEIRTKNAMATKTAGDLVGQFAGTANQLATVGMFASAGGGAGRGMEPKNKH